MRVAGAWETASLAQQMARPNLYLQYSQVFVRHLFACEVISHAPATGPLQRDEAPRMSRRHR
jgi:hypothetical protein